MPVDDICFYLCANYYDAGDTLKGELNGLISQFSRQFDGFDIQQIMVPFLEVLEKVTTIVSLKHCFCKSIIFFHSEC